MASLLISQERKNVARQTSARGEIIAGEPGQGAAGTKEVSGEFWNHTAKFSTRRG